MHKLVDGLSLCECFHEFGDENAVDFHTVELGSRDLDARKIDVVFVCVEEVDGIKRTEFIRHTSNYKLQSNSLR